MDAAVIAAKRGEYRDLKAKALQITDQAVSEDRALTEAEASQLKEHVEAAKAIGRELDSARVGASPELLKALDDLSRRPEMWSNTPQPEPGSGVALGTTLGIKAADTPHPWTVAIEQASRARGEKSFSAPSGSIPLPPLSTVPFSMGQLGAPLVAAIGLRSWPADGGRAVTYLRQTARVTRAAIWRYGAAADGSDTAAKPTTDLTTVAVVANAEIVAHTASPVRKADLADFGGLDAWVGNELGYGIAQALEAAVINQTGAEPQLARPAARARHDRSGGGRYGGDHPTSPRR